MTQAARLHPASAHLLDSRALPALVIAHHHRDALLQAGGRLPVGVVDQRQVQVILLDACVALPTCEHHFPPRHAIFRWRGCCLDLPIATRLVVCAVIDGSTHSMADLALCMQGKGSGFRRCQVGWAWGILGLSRAEMLLGACTNLYLLAGLQQGVGRCRP